MMKNITLLLFVFGTIPLTIYFGWIDIRYWLHGETVEGTVLSAKRRSEASDQSIDLVYSFVDPRIGQRLEKYHLGAAWDVPVGTIEIEFIPGEPGWSRAAGDLSPSVFLRGGTGLLLLLVLGMLIHRHFTRDSENSYRELNSE